MISVDDTIRYHRDQVECLKLVGRAAKTQAFNSNRFQGSTPAEVQVRLGELRYELDRSSVLTLMTSAEATLKRDYEGRRAASGSRVPALLRRMAFRLHLPTWSWSSTGTLEHDLAELHVRFGSRLKFESLLDAWKNAGADKTLVGQFKQLVKHRHWLAHGRYFRDQSGWFTPPDPESVYSIVTALFHELSRIRADFPRL